MCKADAGVLYLEVTPNGVKRWFWKYRAGDSLRAMALGHDCKAGSTKTEMSLKAARVSWLLQAYVGIRPFLALGQSCLGKGSDTRAVLLIEAAIESFSVLFCAGVCSAEPCMPTLLCGGAPPAAQRAIETCQL